MLAEIYPNVTISDIAHLKLLFHNLGINLSADLPLQFRLYAIVWCFWIVIYYLCYEIGNEWYDNLELRRYYYLEANHFKKSKKWIRRMRKHGNEELYVTRDPWIPNPDYPATVPSIGLCK